LIKGLRLNLEGKSTGER